MFALSNAEITVATRVCAPLCAGTTGERTALKFKGVDFIELDTLLSDDERLVLPGGG